MNDDYKEARIATGDEDTISLIDIMAVLLRHRRLILLSTLCAAALAVAAYCVYPLYRVAAAERELVVEANMMLMSSASFEGILNQTDGSNFIMQSLRDPSNILEAMQKAGYEDLDKIDIRVGANTDKAIYAVRRQILENKAIDGSTLKEASRRFVVSFDKGVISIIFKNGEPQKAKAFLQALTGIIDNDIRKFILPSAKNIIDSYERLLRIEKPNDVIDMSLVQGSQGYSIAKSLIDGSASPLLVLRQPYVLVPEISIKAIKKDVLKKSVILVFAVFFLSVFAAFIIQYVDTVKKDAEAMAKLREALKKK